MIAPRLVVRVVASTSLALAMSASTAVAVAQEQEPHALSVPELTSAHASLDGSVVVFDGEAIGEAIGSDPDEFWINVLDDGVAVGVVAPRSWEARIDSWGDYDTVGTRVKIVGVLNLVCDEHGGDLDVHAREMTVRSEGREIDRSIDWERGVIGVVLLGFGGALMYVYATLKRRTL